MPAFIRPEDEYFTNGRLAGMFATSAAILTLCAASTPAPESHTPPPQPGALLIGNAPSFPEVCGKLQGLALKKVEKAYHLTVHQPAECAAAPVTLYYGRSVAGSLHDGDTVPVTCANRFTHGDSTVETSIHGIALGIRVTTEAVEAHATTFKRISSC